MSKKIQFTKRENGEGTVYPIDGGKRWGAAVSLGKDENGKRLRHIETGKGEQEVKDKMTLWLNQNGYGDEETIVINPQSLIDEMIEDFKVNVLLASKISSRTYDNYCNVMKLFQVRFTGKTIAEIGNCEVNRFFRELESKKKDNGEYVYSQVTLDRLLYIVKRMYIRAVKKGFTSCFPFSEDMGDKFIAPKSNKETEKVSALTEEDITYIIKKISENKIVYPVYKLMSATGVRTQEAIALKWKDIDFEKNAINIHAAITTQSEYDNKGNKLSCKTVLSCTKHGTGNRIIVVPEEVIKELVDWRNRAPHISKTKTLDDDFIFGNNRNSSWSYSGVKSAVNKCFSKEDKDNDKIDHLRLHRIRHTVATMMSDEEGVSVFNIMQLLGHTQIKTAQVYIEAATKRREDKNQKRLGNIFARMNGVKKESCSKSGSES